MIIIIIIIIFISYTFRLIWLCVLVFLVRIYFTKKKKRRGGRTIRDKKYPTQLKRLKRENLHHCIIRSHPMFPEASQTECQKFYFPTEISGFSQVNCKYPRTPGANRVLITRLDLNFAPKFSSGEQTKFLIK